MELIRRVTSYLCDIDIAYLTLHIRRIRPNSHKFHCSSPSNFHFDSFHSSAIIWFLFLIIIMFSWSSNERRQPTTMMKIHVQIKFDLWEFSTRASSCCRLSLPLFKSTNIKIKIFIFFVSWEFHSWTTNIWCFLLLHSFTSSIFPFHHVHHTLRFAMRRMRKINRPIDRYVRSSFCSWKE